MTYYESYDNILFGVQEDDYFNDYGYRRWSGDGTFDPYDYDYGVDEYEYNYDERDDC